MKCAIITPGYLPVPATRGGAVEGLINELIDLNETKQKIIIDLYTITDTSLSKSIKEKYKFTKIIEVKIKRLDILKTKFYHITNNKFGSNENIISSFGVAVNRMLKKRIYDYIIVENNMSVFNSITNKAPKIFHLHNDILGENDFRSKYLCKKVINESYSILNVSEYLKNRMNSVIASSKNKVLYNCVDLNIFCEEKVDKKNVNSLLKSYDLNDKFIFMYSGRLVEEKGVLELIKSFKKLVNSKKNIRLLIIGKGLFGKESLSTYEKILFDEAKDIKDYIIFTGFINHDRLPDYLYLSNVVIIPSKWDEPFGVVALEAMAMKKAIIATNSGGLVEPLNKECAIIIERENLVENLYNSMEKLYKDEKIRERLANNAYERVHSIKDFNKEYYFDNFLKLSGIGDENSNENK